MTEENKKEFQTEIPEAKEVLKAEHCEIKQRIDETGQTELKCSGGIDEKCNKCEKAKMDSTISKSAVLKLREELAEAKEQTFAEPIIGYLIKRCEDDEGLSEDVCQLHKSWDKCLEYIYDQAKKSADGKQQCTVRYDVVYEWAEDYYHRDDKAEEEKRAKEAEERKKKQAENAKKRADAAKTNAVQKKAAVQTPRKKPEETQPKSKKDISGQMSFFDFV